MKKYILAIDQGTTGTTALLIDAKTMKVAADSGKDYQQHYPKPSWVEHDLNQIWETVEWTVSDVIKKVGIKGTDILSIGITNQRETTCAYDSKGKPLYHALVWQDRRTAEWCHDRKEAFNSRYQHRTGLPLDPYFSATKMCWLLENVSEVRKAAEASELHFSTIDTFLLFRLTAGDSFCTEPTNASRTQLMNLETFQWDSDLLSYFDVDKKFLPEIKETFSDFGKTKGLSFLPDGIPINCLIGDQQSALFGQACIKQGDLKCTYGTGAFLLLNIGSHPVFSKTGLLTTAASFYKGKKVYALEGSTYIAGAAVQWLRDNLSFIDSSSEVEGLASSIKDLTQMEHLLFFPFFSGIGTPYWVSEAKAAILGMTRDTSKAHLARACLDGIALSINDSIQSFYKDFGTINDIKVDGGATANNLLMEIQANFSYKKILRPKNIETTSLGAALGALVGQGEITPDDITKLWELDREFTPESKSLSYYDKKSTQWNSTIKRLYL